MSWKMKLVVVVIAIVIGIGYVIHQKQIGSNNAKRYDCEISAGAGNCVKDANGNWVPYGSQP